MMGYAAYIVMFGAKVVRIVCLYAQYINVRVAYTLWISTISMSCIYNDMFLRVQFHNFNFQTM